MDVGISLFYYYYIIYIINKIKFYFALLFYYYYFIIQLFLLLFLSSESFLKKCNFLKNDLFKLTYLNYSMMLNKNKIWILT